MKLLNIFSRILFISCFCVFSTGCYYLVAPLGAPFYNEYTTVPAEYNLSSLKSEKILVIPFKEKDGFYFESEKGRKLAEQIELNMRHKIKNLEIIDSSSVLKSETPLQLETADWASTGRNLGAGYILLGEIISFKPRDSRAANPLSGSATVDAKLLKISDGAKAVWLRKVNSHFPEGLSIEQIGASPFDMTEETVEDGLLMNIAMDVIGNFYNRKVRRFEAGREKIYK